MKNRWRELVQGALGRLGYRAVPLERWRLLDEAWDDPLNPELTAAGLSGLLGLSHFQHGLIALNARIVYFPIPKAANSYMRRWLNQVEAHESGLEGRINPPYTAYGSGHQFVHTIGQVPSAFRSILQVQDLRYISVVRDPLDRLLSCYFDKRRQPAGSLIRRKLPIGAGETFDAFVHSLAEGEKILADGHWAPQSHILAPVEHLPIQLLNVENLEEHLRSVCEAWGIAFIPPQPDDRKHRTARIRRGVFPTKPTVDLVRRLYEQDYRLIARAGEK